MVLTFINLDLYCYDLVQSIQFFFWGLGVGNRTSYVWDVYLGQPLDSLIPVVDATVGEISSCELLNDFIVVRILR